MPRYTYECLECRECFDVYHGILDDHTQCSYCPSKRLKRVPQMPYIRREQVSEGNKVGEATRQAIEENRSILREEKKKRVEYKDGD